MRRGWQPLYDSDEARRAVDAIAARLATPCGDTPALADGAAGRALFFGYLAKARGGAAAAALARAHRDAVVDGVAAVELRDALFTGVVGAAWTLAHLDGSDYDGDEVDEVVAELLARTPWSGHFDLVFGLAGHGVYALERAGAAVGRRCLAQVVAHLAALAVPYGDGGLLWHSRPELILDERRAAHPRGYFDCGAAHGAPGIAAVLAGAARAGIPAARPLLNACMRALVAVARSTDAMPAWIPVDGAPAVPSPRVGWCYGDAGVACALVAAARAVGEPAWADVALALGRRAAARALAGDPAAAGVVDAGLCHGAAGVALLFHRLWHDTPEPRFADAARRYYALAAALAAGVVEDGLLTGAAGVGLALLAGSGDVAPAWDCVFAASLPEVPRG